MNKIFRHIGLLVGVVVRMFALDKTFGKNRLSTKFQKQADNYYA